MSFFTTRTSSASGQVNAYDLWASTRDGVLIALCAGAIAALEAIDAIDFGDWNTLVAAVVSTLVLLIRRLLKDYSPQGPPPT